MLGHTAQVRSSHQNSCHTLTEVSEGLSNETKFLAVAVASGPVLLWPRRAKSASFAYSKITSVQNSTFVHHFSQNVSILELRTLRNVGMCPADRYLRLESLAEGLKLGDLLRRAMRQQRGGGSIVNAVWAFLPSRIQNYDIGLN